MPVGHAIDLHEAPRSRSAGRYAVQHQAAEVLQFFDNVEPSLKWIALKCRWASARFAGSIVQPVRPGG